MSNILNAIINITNKSELMVKKNNYSSNRINAEGESLENFVKDLFGGDNEFSYLGSKNKPPDLILKGGDAIEIKKIETINTDIHFNSSFPKSKLYADDDMISNDCKNCEKLFEEYYARMQTHTSHTCHMYKRMLSNYIKNSDCVCIVFDLTDTKSWEQVPFWVEASQLEGNMPLFIIANKVDLESSRRIKDKNIKSYLRSLRQRHTDIYYLEVSAKTGENSRETFQLSFEKACATK